MAAVIIPGLLNRAFTGPFHSAMDPNGRLFRTYRLWGYVLDPYER